MITSPVALKAVQNEIAFAYENVGFFRKHMEKAGLTPKDVVSAEAITKIPPTTKADYRRNFPLNVLAKGRSLNDPGLIKLQSAGTESDRLVTVVGSLTLASRMATCVRMNAGFKFLLSPGLGRPRTARYAAPNCSDVECSNPNSTMADRMMWGGSTLVLPVFHDLMTTTESMSDRAAAEIKEFDPHLLYVDSSHLAFLVRAMRRRGLRPPKVTQLAIAASFTMTTAVNRRQICDFFGAPVPFASAMAMSEFGFIGLECSAGRMHLNTRDYHLEMLVDGRVARAGELAELFVTSLGDLVSPHIRYRTGDLYRLRADPCSCGSEFQSVHVEGRVRHLIHREDNVPLTAAAVDELVGPAAWTCGYQLEQSADDRYVFRFIPSETYSRKDEHALAEKLQVTLGPKARLTLEQNRYIASERSGKLVACKSAVAERRAAEREGA